MNDIQTQTGCMLKDKKLGIFKRIENLNYNYSLKKKELIHCCDLCLSPSNHHRVYSPMDRYGLPVRSMICNKCGLIFINPLMTKENYDDFYKRWYRQFINAFNGREETEHNLGALQRFQTKHLMKFLKRHLPPEIEQGEMIDIGGSAGVLAKELMKAYKFEKGYVLDPSEVEVRQATDKGLTAFCGSIEDHIATHRAEKKYSFVSMIKTIEHLRSIKQTLQWIRTVLKDNGFVFIDCVDHLFLMKMIKDVNLTTKLDHIYQLTEKTVESYFERTGFSVYAKEQHQRYITYLLKIEKL